MSELLSNRCGRFYNKRQTQSIFITILEILLASSDQFDKLPVTLSSVSAKYQETRSPLSFKALSLTFHMYAPISYLCSTISITEDCSLMWSTFLIMINEVHYYINNSHIRIRRKTQPCVCSWPTELGSRAGQVTTVLSRKIYWLLLHRARQGGSTPGMPPGLLAPGHVRSMPRDWRTGGEEKVAVETGESSGILCCGELPCQVSA